MANPNPYLDDDSAPDNDPGDAMLAQAPLPPSPIPVAQSGQNVQKQFQNLADSSAQPTNKRVYDEGKARPLFNAVTDFANGAMSSSDFQNLVKTMTAQSSKNRQGIDTRNRAELQGLAGITKMMGNANTEDIDALADAVLMHKTMQQADTEYQRSARDAATSNIEQSLAPFMAAGGNRPNAPGSNQGIAAQAGMIGRGSREGNMMYMNAHGIQQFGPEAPNGNYKAMDSWQAIAHDRNAERQQNEQQLQQLLAGGLAAHLQAAQAQQQQGQLAAAMGLAQGAAGLRKNEAEMKWMDKEAQSNIDYKKALANPSAGKQLGYIAQILKSNPELADQMNLSGLFNQVGVGKPDEPKQPGLMDRVAGMIYGNKQGGQTEQQPKDFGGSVSLNDAQHGQLDKIEAMKDPKARDAALSKAAKLMNISSETLRKLRSGRQQQQQ